MGYFYDRKAKMLLFLDPETSTVDIMEEVRFNSVAVDPAPAPINTEAAAPRGKTIKVKKLKYEKVPFVKKTKAKSFDDAMIYKIRDLKKQGLTIEEIVKEVHLSKSTVYRISSGQVQPGGTTLTTGNGKGKKEMKEQIHALVKQGKKAQEIAEITGLKIANVYYYMKDATPAKEMPETPTKWGEREIDKAPEIISEDDFGEIKEGHNDGMSLGSFKISMPQYDLQEMQRVVTFDSYSDYKASRK